MPENATPSEGVQKRSTAKVGLGEVLATWDIFADIHNANLSCSDASP